MNRARTPPARLRWASAALAATLLVAACGSSSPTATSSPTTASRAAASSSSAGHSAGINSTLAFSECMRGHGVPRFPDLNGNGMRIAASGQTISVDGFSFSTVAFAAARQKCQRYMPHTTASPGQAAQQHLLGLKFARCMRGHGVTNLADPKVTSGSGVNQVARLTGVTAQELQSPTFQAAAKACGGGPKGP